MASKQPFLLSMLVVVMTLLAGCGHAGISRRNFTPPPGYNPAKLWISHHIPPHHAYFEYVGHNKNSFYFAEFVNKTFRLALDHHTYTIPAGSTIKFTLSSASAQKLELITIKKPIDKFFLKISPGKVSTVPYRSP